MSGDYEPPGCWEERRSLIKGARRWIRWHRNRYLHWWALEVDGTRRTLLLLGPSKIDSGRAVIKRAWRLA